MKVNAIIVVFLVFGLFGLVFVGTGVGVEGRYWITDLAAKTSVTANGITDIF